MARSMLSIGTELSRAFWILVRSVALESGSPPPDLAATSISRHRRAKSFPRAASAAPFLCLMECHFECPLTGRPPGVAGSHVAEERLVDPEVAGELRVEGADPDRAR